MLSLLACMRNLLLAIAALCPLTSLTATDKFPIEEGFADANGLLIYYRQIGVGEPLVILHGGPGASHEYFLPYFHSTSKMNAVFQKELEAMPPETRHKILALEKAGLYGRGKDYEKNRYPEAYMKAAWGEGYFPYLYQNRPNPNYDPVEDGKISWDLYREMWGSHGEFIIDGNLKSVEYADRLSTIRVPTLIVVGDHDECDPALAREMNSLISGSKLSVLPKSGHFTFVDQNGPFVQTVGEFLSLRE